MDTTQNPNEIRKQAAALIEEAQSIGDRFGNMGPAARRRKDALFAEANALNKEARRIEREQESPLDISDRNLREDGINYTTAELVRARRADVAGQLADGEEWITVKVPSGSEVTISAAAARLAI